MDFKDQSVCIPTVWYQFGVGMGAYWELYEQRVGVVAIDAQRQVSSSAFEDHIVVPGNCAN